MDFVGYKSGMSNASGVTNNQPKDPLNSIYTIEGPSPLPMKEATDSYQQFR